MISHHPLIIKPSVRTKHFTVTDQENHHLIVITNLGKIIIIAVATHLTEAFQEVADHMKLEDPQVEETPDANLEAEEVNQADGELVIGIVGTL